MTVAIPSNCEHGEGIVCDTINNTLHWVDIHGQAIFTHDLTTKATLRIALPEQIGFVLPDKHKPGFLIAGMQRGLYRIELATESLTLLGDPERGKPNNRFNDAKYDRQGRIWVSTMDCDAADGCGALYCCEIQPDDSVSFTQFDKGFTIGNGPTWSIDYKTFYHTETRRSTIFAYDFDEKNGTISNKRALYTHDEPGVRPDGMCTDQDNHLWVALAHGGRLLRLSPDGKVAHELPVNTSFPTSCAFFGDDKLYITTSKRVSAVGEKTNELSGNLLLASL